MADCADTSWATAALGSVILSEVDGSLALLDCRPARVIHPLLEHGDTAPWLHPLSFAAVSS